MGGAERMSINTGEELLKKGVDVYYIIQQPIFEIPHNIPNERIIVLRKKENETTLDKLWALFWGIFRESKKIKPDVVIAFSRFSSLLACFTFNKNIIGRFDMNPYTLYKKQHFWANFVLRFPYVRKVVVPSTGMLKALQNAKPKYAKKFVIIPNSIKQDEILIQKDNYKNPYDFPYISAMGRLSQQKNFQLLIKAFSRSEINKKMKLVIIGDGRLKDELKELAINLNMESKIVFTGRLKNPYPVVANSNFFVNTSSRESFCNVILEALTLKKPVVATDCDYGPSDMVDDGKNGFLIESDNLDQLIERLNQMNEISQLKYDQFSQNAAETAARFSIKMIGIKWLNLINQVGVKSKF